MMMSTIMLTLGLTFWRPTFLIRIALFSLIIASLALAKPEFTNTWEYPSPQVGKRFRLEWKNAVGDVELTLRYRDLNDPTGNTWLYLKDIAVVQGSNFYDWTPDSTERDVAIRIVDESPPDEENYNFSHSFDIYPEGTIQETVPTLQPTSFGPSTVGPMATSTTANTESTTSTTPAPFPTSNPTIPTPNLDAAVSGFDALSTGAKAGIGAGAGASAILLLVLIGFIFYRRGKAAGIKTSAAAFGAGASAGGFGGPGGGGGRGGGNPEDVEFGGRISATGVYSPAPDSELGVPAPIMSVNGTSTVGDGSVIGGIGGFVSSDNKSVPTLVSSVPDLVPPTVHGNTNGNATSAPPGGPGMTQINTMSDLGRDTPTNFGPDVGHGPGTGGGEAAVGGDGAVGGVGNANNSNADNNFLNLTTFPPYPQPPVAQPSSQSQSPPPPPGPGIYEMPVSPGIAHNTMQVVPQGAMPMPAPGQLVNNQQYVLYATNAAGQPVTVAIQPYFVEVDGGLGRMGPAGDRQEGR